MLNGVKNLADMRKIEIGIEIEIEIGIEIVKRSLASMIEIRKTRKREEGLNYHIILVDLNQNLIPKIEVAQPTGSHLRVSILQMNQLEIKCNCFTYQNTILV